MKLNKQKLLNLIREAIEQDPEAVEGAHPHNAPKYQVNDKLVTALQGAILQEFLDADLVGKGPGQMTENDIALEFEELMMDAFLPIAERIDSIMGQRDGEESSLEPQRPPSPYERKSGPLPVYETN